MTGGGRPLRFLLLVMGGWVADRATMLWPGDPVTAVVPQALAEATPRLRPMPPVQATPPIAQVRAGHGQVIAAPPHASLSYRTGMTAAVLPARPAGTPLPAAPAPPSDAHAGIVAGLPAAGPPPADDGRSRFFGSAWFVARGGRGPAGGVPGVQLGGSQAGVRLGYALTGDRRLALVGRAASPLGAGMRELALGVEWQPTRLPVRIVAEQRFALNAGTGGPTLAAVGGIGPVPLSAGFRLEAYAQGGVIGRGGGEAFADGAIRVARPTAAPGGIRVDLGGGAWGAAQKGARRLDVGPSLSATVPIGPQAVRLSIDWRQRVAGNAAPGSGLVLSLGADF